MDEEFEHVDQVYTSLAEYIQSKNETSEMSHAFGNGFCK